MSKPASKQVLAGLHRKFAEYLEHILDESMRTPEHEDDMVLPLDAATMGCISRFLKDNEITAEPESDFDLEALREKYSSRSREGKVAEASVSSILQAAGESEKYLN